MATRVEIGWQSEKTLGECMSYMLDNEIATDVCFEVGPPGGATVNIRAHRVILMARSPVFDAMFSSGMTECRNGPDEKIQIEDINADILKSFLKYIYCDNIEISPEAAPSLMYAAKKYLLPKLSKECSNILQTSLKVENVCFLLDQSLLFSEETLRDDCLNLISNNSTQILESKEFPNASRQALEAILKIERMRSKESTVYKNCENWAKHQLSLHQSIENPSDEQIRETLGRLLFCIRFPIMHPEEFADLLGNRNVLTAEEKSSVYFYYIKKEKSSTLRFDANKRHIEENFVDLIITLRSLQRSAGSSIDSVAFTTNKEVQLRGLCLYTGLTTGCDVDIKISDHEKSLFKTKFTTPYTDDRTPFNVPFDPPIAISTGVIYTIVVSTEFVEIPYREYDGDLREGSRITLALSNSTRSGGRNVTTYNQITQLFLFKISDPGS